MGNSSSAHGRLLAAVANDDDTFIKQLMLAADGHERYKLLGAKAGWANKTCFHLCAKEGKCKVLAALLVPFVIAVTAEIDAGAYPGRASHLLSRLVNKQQREGQTPFLTACYCGQWQCAEQLLEAGSNVFAVDKDGNSAVHLAAINSHAGVVEQLLVVADHQAITSRLASIVNLSGFTPLHYAAWAGCAGVAQQLLAAGVDPLQATWGEYDKWLVVPLGSTALHVAALQLRPDVCMVLLQHYVLQLQDWLPGDPVPVDPRTRVNCQGQSAYHAALWKGLDASSQLALLLNPNVDICSLFNRQQISQHRKRGPPALRIIASTAVKQHLLQQLSVLEDQHQQLLQDRELQLHQHSKQHGHHGQQQHQVPGQHQMPGQHHNTIASSSLPSLAAAAAVAGQAVAAPATAVSRNITSEPGCSRSLAAAGPADSSLKCNSKRGLLKQAGPDTAKQDPTGLPGVKQHDPALPPGANLVAGFMQQLQAQPHHGAEAVTIRTGLCEIEVCDEQPATVIDASVGSADHQQQQHCSMEDPYVLHSQHDRPHSALAPMLAPGSLAIRSHSRTDISQKGRLSYSSSMQHLSGFDSNRHSGPVSILTAAGPSAVDASRAADVAGHCAPVSGRGSGSLKRFSFRRTNSRSSSSSWSRDLLSGAAAAEGVTGGNSRPHLDHSDSSAVFGASTQCIAQILRDTGVSDPSSLSYRHLTTHGRTVSMTAATSLAGALPGCVSERLSHSLQGDVLASFSGTCGLVVGMGPRTDSSHGGPMASSTGTHVRVQSAAECLGRAEAAPENAEATRAAHDMLCVGPSACSTSAGSVTCSAAHGSVVQHSCCTSWCADECGVCLDRPPAVLLVACDHVLCFECSKCIASESVGCRAPLCPFCRTIITGFGLVPLPAVHPASKKSTAGASGSLGRLSHRFRVAAGHGRDVGRSLLSPREAAVAGVVDRDIVNLSSDIAPAKRAGNILQGHAVVHAYADGQSVGAPHVAVAWAQ